MGHWLPSPSHRGPANPCAPGSHAAHHTRTLALNTWH